MAGEMIKLKVELKDIGAKRVVVVPGDATLMSLHDIIQALFGWEDCHLWMFSNEKGRNIWEPPPPDSSESEHLDPCDFSVEDMLQEVGDHAEYEYDFGDSWHHRVTRMADPKPGTEYGCVKSEGPDGVEDSRFSGDDLERRIPTVDDVNRRLPALDSLERLAQVANLSEDANGGAGPTVLDILNAKPDAELEALTTGMPGTAGLSGDALRRAAAAFVGAGEGLEVAVKGLISSITELYFKAFAKAAKEGAATMENTGMEEVSVFSVCALTHVQRSGTRGVRLLVAKEVRDAWPKMCMQMCSFHNEWDTIHALADAAVRLYGGVTVHEFAGILDRFGDYDICSEAMLEGALNNRSTCWDSTHFVEDGTICSDRFESLDDYRKFARRRDAYPRWETDDFEEFYAYSDARHFEDTPQREAFIKFCMSVFRDSRETAIGVVNQIQEELVGGSSPEEVAEYFAVDFADADRARRAVDEIARLVGDIRDNMRLADYNGNKFASLPKSGPVVRADSKVGRNDPCPCGSGLKYKKCCGRRG